MKVPRAQLSFNEANIWAEPRGHSNKKSSCWPCCSIYFLPLPSWTQNTKAQKPHWGFLTHLQTWIPSAKVWHIIVECLWGGHEPAPAVALKGASLGRYLGSAGNICQRPRGNGSLLTLGPCSVWDWTVEVYFFQSICLTELMLPFILLSQPDLIMPDFY